ncbi:hypothetical protein ES702_04810 [subsurface metagenome]
MKKVAILVLITIVISLLFVGILLAERNDDIQAIKKAVKKNPAYKAGNEVRWFKVLITDNRTKKDKVRITLPVSLIEFFIKCTDDKHLRINRDECDIDLKELFAELKKLGPTVLIEVHEDEETVKVWFE